MKRRDEITEALKHRYRRARMAFTNPENSKTQYAYAAFFPPAHDCDY